MACSESIPTVEIFLDSDNSGHPVIDMMSSLMNCDSDASLVCHVLQCQHRKNAIVNHFISVLVKGVNLVSICFHSSSPWNYALFIAVCFRYRRRDCLDERSTFSWTKFLPADIPLDKKVRLKPLSAKAAVTPTLLETMCCSMEIGFVFSPLRNTIMSSALAFHFHRSFLMGDA